MAISKPIHEVFAAVVKVAPDRIALRCESRVLTYGALNDRAERIAAALTARGIGPGALVGLYTQRSMEAVAAMIGVLKAGAAYVPFDPSYPAKLLEFVHGDCRPALMLVQRSLRDDPAQRQFWRGEALEIDGDFGAFFGPLAATARSVGRDACAYVMYTSGSTGHPKGVRVPHRGVVRLVIDNPFATMDQGQTHLQLAPLAFDASTFEIWGALLNGGTLAILPASHPSLDDIAAAIEQHGVTTLWLTAGLFHLMVDQRLQGLKPLRQLLAGGDVLSPAHVARAQAALPLCQLINGYGPTENTTFTCCYRIPPGHPADCPVPIGTPIAHTTVHIVNERGMPVGNGEEGELQAGGDGVALGYLNRPELDAERFVPDRHGAEPGRLLYRTGDRVRRRADGVIEFLGRVDRQVKISGKRVELDEIEAALRRSGLIDDAAVTSPATGSGMRKLYAYVQSSQPAEALVPQLRKFLHLELPDYMQPAVIVVMAALPLSPAGKIDRAKLPPPAAPPTGLAGAPAVATSVLESALLRIWREVLETDVVGLEDNFFDLGGTSLQLLQAHAKIRSDMALELNVLDLFQYPRVGLLAAWLAGRAAGTGVAAARPSSLTAADRASLRQAALARARQVAGRSP